MIQRLEDQNLHRLNIFGPLIKWICTLLAFTEIMKSIYQVSADLMAR